MSLIGTYKLKLADGRVIVIRDAELNDAESLLACTRANIADTDVLLMDPSEFKVTVEEEHAWITELRDAENAFIMVAVDEDAVVGVLDFRTSRFLRERHHGSFGIALKSGYRGVGIGTRMIEIMIEWVRQHPELERIGLSVFATNSRAIKLYESLGFKAFGRSPGRYKLADGTYADNVLMYQFVQPSVKER